MSNDTIQIQEKLEGWAKETINVYNRIVETLNEKSPDISLEERYIKSRYIDIRN